MGFAEFDRDMIVERTTRGQRGKAARGAWPGGTAPYGYRLVGKGATRTAEFDQQERDTLLQATAWIVDDGLTTGEVAQRLNALGRAPRHADAWEHRNLRRTLTSEKLLGRVVWGQASSRRGDHKTRLLADGTPKYGEPVELRIPPILDEARFAALQKALADKGGWTRRPDGVYPLSLRLVSPCGDTYGGVYRRDRSKRQYRCRRAKWNAAGVERCTDVRLDADYVEGAVWGEVCELLSDADRLQALAQEWLDKQATVTGPDADDIETRIADRRRALTSTVVEYAKAGLPPGAVKAATETIQDKLRRASGVAGAGRSRFDRGARVAELTALAESAQGRLASMTFAEQKEVLALLDVRVTVLDDTARPALRVEGRVPPNLLMRELAGGEPAAGASTSRGRYETTVSRLTRNVAIWSRSTSPFGPNVVVVSPENSPLSAPTSMLRLWVLSFATSRNRASPSDSRSRSSTKSAARTRNVAICARLTRAFGE